MEGKKRGGRERMEGERGGGGKERGEGRGEGKRRRERGRKEEKGEGKEVGKTNKNMKRNLSAKVAVLVSESEGGSYKLGREVSSCVAFPRPHTPWAKSSLAAAWESGMRPFPTL